MYIADDVILRYAPADDNHELRSRCERYRKEREAARDEIDLLRDQLDKARRRDDTTSRLRERGETCSATELIVFCLTTCTVLFPRCLCGNLFHWFPCDLSDYKSELNVSKEEGSYRDSTHRRTSYQQSSHRPLTNGYHAGTYYARMQYHNRHEFIIHVRYMYNAKKDYQDIY